jgi:hypothetical protein
MYKIILIDAKLKTGRRSKTTKLNSIKEAEVLIGL